MDALTVYERLAAEHAAHLTGGVYSKQHELEVVHDNFTGYQYRLQRNDVTREMAYRRVQENLCGALHGPLCLCCGDPRDTSYDYSRLGTEVKS